MNRIRTQKHEDTKNDLRRTMLARRSATDAAWRAEASKRITQFALGLTNVKQAKEISAYLSYKSEVDTTALVKEFLKMKVRLLIPRVEARSGLVLHRVDAFPEGFEKGSYGILEPMKSVYPEVASVESLDVIFMPGIAFDLGGRRIGYGKAYYDRLLAGPVKAIKIGLAFSLQIVEAIPEEPHDVRVDAVITERGVMEFAPK